MGGVGDNWANFAYGEQAEDWESRGANQSPLQIEDMLRHGNHSRSQMQGKKSLNRFHQAAVTALTNAKPLAEVEEVVVAGQTEVSRTDVLSPLQLRLIYDICKSPGRSLGSAYEHDCKLAREGNGAAVPASRCSADIAYKGAISISDSLFEADRRWLTTSRLRMVSFREDARGSQSQFLGLAVDVDWNVRSFLLGLAGKSCEGDAISKAKHFDKMLLGCAVPFWLHIWILLC